jgi:large subunit ribosomal protein L2
MPVKTYRPLTPSRRFYTVSSFDEITKSRPEKSLVVIRKKTGGRNTHGRVTARGIGGGHKQKIRIVDFKRRKTGMDATVVGIEYDPCRSARIALVQYADGEKRYILAPNGLQAGQKIRNGADAAPEVGNCLPLRIIPIGMSVHAIEITPGRGAQIVRSAGGAATLMSRDEGFAQLRLPSGEIRRVNEDCMAPLGRLATSSMRIFCWARLDVPAGWANAPSREAWPAIPSTIPTAVVRGSPRVVAVGSR